MNIQPLNLSVDQEHAVAALKQYREHRNAYDKRDWEIERIYRAIAKGKTVISVNDAIVKAGIDAQGRPRLAIMRADQDVVICDAWNNEKVTFKIPGHFRGAEWYFQIPWPNRAVIHRQDAVARLPRIPPQYRPAQGTLPNYHLLWEADWSDIPRDPYLLKRIGRDAWVVLAAWDLTDVELSVLRAHERV